MGNESCFYSIEFVTLPKAWGKNWWWYHGAPSVNGGNSEQFCPKNIHRASWLPVNLSCKAPSCFIASTGAINTGDYCLCLGYYFVTQGTQTSESTTGKETYREPADLPRATWTKPRQELPRETLCDAEKNGCGQKYPQRRKTGLGCCYCGICFEVSHTLPDLEGSW